MKPTFKRQQLLSLVLFAGFTICGSIAVSHPAPEDETQAMDSNPEGANRTIDSKWRNEPKRAKEFMEPVRGPVKTNDKLHEPSKKAKRKVKDEEKTSSDKPRTEPAESLADLLKTGTAAVKTPSLAESISIVGPVFRLADVERLALENNPVLAQANACSSKAQGLYQQVGTRPNPTMGYFGQQIADRGTDQHGLFIEQEFVRGDKLELNRQVLARTAEAQRLEVEVQRHRILTDVRTQFFAAVAAQQRRDATLEFSELTNRAVEIAEARFEAEEGTRIEILQAETLASEVSLAFEQAEIEYIGSWGDLSAIAGIQSSVPIRLEHENARPTQRPDWNAELNKILAVSPQLASAHAIVCEKQVLIQRQKAQPISNITTQFGAGYDAATDNGMINLQLSAPIPTNNKNAGNISAAYADYARAVENVRRIERLIRSQLAQTSQAYESAFATVRKYEDQIIPQVLKSLELCESAYAAGELDFLQVLIVRRSYYESTVRLIAAQGQLAQAAAKVDGLLLTGGLDQPADYTDGDGIRGASMGGQ